MSLEAVNLSFSFRTPLTFYHLWAHTLESHSLWWAQTGVEGWWSWTDHCWPDLMVSIVKMAVNEHVILSRTSSPSESFSWLINVSINRWSLKRKRLQEKIPWEGEFRPKRTSVRPGHQKEREDAKAGRVNVLFLRTFSPALKRRKEWAGTCP